MSAVWRVPLALGLLVMSLSLPAADRDRGRLLYENHCVACHDSIVHIRDNRRARTLADVGSWVARWNNTLALEWSAEEQGDVSAYVYHRFYAVE